MTDPKGCTALHYSAQLGSYESVKFFAAMELISITKQAMGKCVITLQHSMDI